MTVHSCCISHSLRITRKGCIHAIPPSCQFRGPTFIPCQGDPTTMPALVVLRHRNRSCLSSYPLFPGKIRPRSLFFFLKKGKYTEKTLKTGQRRSKQLFVCSCCATELPQSFVRLLLFQRRLGGSRGRRRLRCSCRSEAVSR